MTPDNQKQAILNKARLDKFLLVLNLPKALKEQKTKSVRTNDLVNLDAIEFSIFGSPVPSLSVPHVDLPYGGQVTKVSSMARPSYPPLTVSFTVDNMYNNWWVLWKWLDLINGVKNSAYNPKIIPQQKAIVGTLNDYATNISIYGLTEFNVRVIRFDYIGAFITDLSEIAFNYRTPDEVTASFTLQYSQFSSELLDS